MSFGLSLITPPEAEPVSLPEAKLHLRLDFVDDDDLVTALIQAARETVEHMLNRPLLAQTWMMTLDHFPYEQSSETYLPSQRDVAVRLVDAYCISIPMGGVTGVTQIQWVENASVKTLQSSDLIVDTTRAPSRVYPVAGQWSYASAIIPAPIQVTFTAGEWTPTTIPVSIKQAILLLVGHLYANREAASDKPLTTLPLAVDSLLARWKVHLC